MTKSNDLLIVSVKPEYAKKILNGEKTIELRKCAPKRVGENDYILIYVTAPVKELWGIYKIENIIKENPNDLWKNHGKQTGLKKHEFYDYFKDNVKAFGIQLQQVGNPLISPIKLDSLRSLIPGFTPPQTYSYTDYGILKKLLN
jgi:predicted transcriptional regulator